MKLFTKISLILAAVAGGVGILAIIIGLLMGADVNDLNNMGIYISPHQQVAVSGVITEVGEEGLMAEVMIEDNIVQHHNETNHNYVPNEINGLHHNYRHHNEKLHNHSCSLKDIDRLKVEIHNAQITIWASEDEENIIYYSNKENSIAKVSGTTLKLGDNTSSTDKIELEIYIPVGVLKEIEIEVVNGTIFAEKMVADNVIIEIDNASVQIDELVVEDKAELQINAGQMIIGYYSGAKLETECGMGSIMVVCQGNQNDYNYDLECGMGQIQINEDNYSGIGKDLKLHNESHKSIKAECGMGEIKLEFLNSL